MYSSPGERRGRGSPATAVLFPARARAAAFPVCVGCSHVHLVLRGGQVLGRSLPLALRVPSRRVGRWRPGRGGRQSRQARVGQDPVRRGGQLSRVPRCVLGAPGSPARRWLQSGARRATRQGRGSGRSRLPSRGGTHPGPQAAPHPGQTRHGLVLERWQVAGAARVLRPGAHGAGPPHLRAHTGSSGLQRPQGDRLDREDGPSLPAMVCGCRSLRPHSRCPSKTFPFEPWVTTKGVLQCSL